MTAVDTSRLHLLNDRFGPDRIADLSASAQELYAQVTRHTDRLASPGNYETPAELADELDQCLSGRLRRGLFPDTPLDRAARFVGHAAFAVGGVTVFGAHWCADHGHRAEPAAPVPEGYLAVAARSSVRWSDCHDFGDWTTVLHQPCCPRTRTEGTEQAVAETARLHSWATDRAAAAMDATIPDPDEYRGHGRHVEGRLCACLSEGKRPLDIITIQGDLLADRYWRLLRDQQFEVRIQPGWTEYTYAPEAPVPGYRLGADLHLWHLYDRHGTLVLDIESEDHAIGASDRDETAALNLELGRLRR